MNADGGFGTWDYAIVSDMGKVGEAVSRAAESGVGSIAMEDARG